MEHVAIDLGGKESQICVRASEGNIIDERRWKTADLREYLGRRPKSRVTFETCAEGFFVADIAMSLGHEVRVVPATLVKALGVGERGLKTDKRDARKLSEMSCRMEVVGVHVPSQQSRERKSMGSMREALVVSRTALINTVRGWMRAQARRVPGGAAETFHKRVQLVSEKKGWEIPSWVERQLSAIGMLTEQIKASDKEMKKLATGDEDCRRSMTMTGVGPLTAIQYKAALDEVERFETAHLAESYIGLTPGERSSSEKQHRTGITKAGSPRLRWLLSQAAWSAMSHAENDPMVQWARQVQLRRGVHVAVIALARKMAGVLYAMWRDKTDYDPARAAALLTEVATKKA